MKILVVLFFLFASFMVDVVDPIRNYFSKLRNRKHSFPLISAGLLEDEDDYFGLHYFLNKHGRTLEDFIENGVSLGNLKMLDYQKSSLNNRIWDTHEQIASFDLDSENQSQLDELNSHFKELNARYEEVEREMWGSIENRETPGETPGVNA